MGTRRQRWMLFRQPFLTAGERIVKIVILSIYIKPRLSTLGQPLRIAAHASDWGDSLNRHHRGGKRNTMVMMFVGGVVLMLDRILVLFLL